MTSQKKLGRGPSDANRRTSRYGDEPTYEKVRRHGRTIYLKHVGGNRSAYRPSAKRWRLEDLYAAIKAHLLEKRIGSSVEHLADRFKAKPGLVHQCLHRMIREGTGLYETANSGPHDTRRDYGPKWKGRPYPIVDLSHWPNGWIATYYAFRDEPKTVSD